MDGADGNREVADRFRWGGEPLREKMRFFFFSFFWEDETKLPVAPLRVSGDSHAEATTQGSSGEGRCLMLLHMELDGPVLRMRWTHVGKNE